MHNARNIALPFYPCFTIVSVRPLNEEEPRWPRYPLDGSICWICSARDYDDWGSGQELVKLISALPPPTIHPTPYPTLLVPVDQLPSHQSLEPAPPLSQNSPSWSSLSRRTTEHHKSSYSSPSWISQLIEHAKLEETSQFIKRTFVMPVLSFSSSPPQIDLVLAKMSPCASPSPPLPLFRWILHNCKLSPMADPCINWEIRTEGFSTFKPRMDKLCKKGWD